LFQSEVELPEPQLPESEDQPKVSGGTHEKEMAGVFSDLLNHPDSSNQTLSKQTSTNPFESANPTITSKPSEAKKKVTMTFDEEDKDSNEELF